MSVCSLCKDFPSAVARKIIDKVRSSVMNLPDLNVLVINIKPSINIPILFDADGVTFSFLQSFRNPRLMGVDVPQGRIRV